MPIKPLPKKQSEEAQTKTVKSGGAQKANKAIVKPKVKELRCNFESNDFIDQNKVNG